MDKLLNYALAADPAVTHVAWKLEGASGPLTLDELAEGYRHGLPSDLHRIKRHEGAADDAAATLWIVKYAADEIKGVERLPDGRYAIEQGKTHDNLRFHGRKVYRPEPDIHTQLRDPFNKMSGEFSDNIRIDLGNLDELRESMRSWGWLPEFPALVDERGVTLVGHRRLTVAKELGIEPVTKVIQFGQGDHADAQRLKYAIASNIGFKPLSPNDRKRLAAYLYKEQEWSQTRIAEALNISQMQVSRDLSELNIAFNSRGGRPRKAKPGRKLAQHTTDNAAELVDKVELEGVPLKKAAEELGLSVGKAKLVYQREMGRREATAETAVIPNGSALPEEAPAADAIAVAKVNDMALELGPSLFKAAVAAVWHNMTGGKVTFE